MLIPEVKEKKSEVVAFPNYLFWDKKPEKVLMTEHGRT